LLVFGANLLLYLQAWWIKIEDAEQLCCNVGCDVAMTKIKGPNTHVVEISPHKLLSQTCCGTWHPTAWTPMLTMQKGAQHSITLH